MGPCLPAALYIERGGSDLQRPPINKGCRAVRGGRPGPRQRVGGPIGRSGRKRKRHVRDLGTGVARGVGGHVVEHVDFGLRGVRVGRIFVPVDLFLCDVFLARLNRLFARRLEIN